MGKLGKSEDRVWYFYKNVETGEHTMTTWDRMTDYFGWIEVTQKDYNQWVVSSELAPADADAPAAPATDAGVITEAEKWQRIEVDYRSTVDRLHRIVEKHKLFAPPGEYVDVTIEREVDKMQAEVAALRTQLAAAEGANARLRSALKVGTVLATKVMAEGGIRAIQTWAKDVVTQHFAAEGAKGEGA